MKPEYETSTLVNRWKKRVKMARDCANEEQLFSAICHYKKAKKIALTLFNQWSHPEQAINAMLMSYDDLARFYCKRNEGMMAQKELREVHEIMLMSLRHRGYDYSHKHILLGGVNRSYSMLLKHLSFNKETRRPHNIQLNRLLLAG